MYWLRAAGFLLLLQLLYLWDIMHMIGSQVAQLIPLPFAIGQSCVLRWWREVMYAGESFSGLSLALIQNPPGSDGVSETRACTNRSFRGFLIIFGKYQIIAHRDLWNIGTVIEQRGMHALQPTIDDITTLKRPSLHYSFEVRVASLENTYCHHLMSNLKCHWVRPFRDLSKESAIVVGYKHGYKLICTVTSKC